MLTLLLGTDWTTNRASVLQRVAEDVRRETKGVILLVPELISHDTERRLCMAAGDTTSRFAEVLSFSRLVPRVADNATHCSQQCLDAGGRIVAMASAVYQIKSRLKAYASLGTKPEFLAGLVDAVDEFKRCCISSSDLIAASRQTEGNLAQKLEELALVLEAYDSVCLHGKRDPRDLMTWLLEELECSTYAQDHVFYIDGFPDFTRQHMAILEHLIRYCPNVTISFNCDCPNSKDLAFEKAGETAAEVINLARKFGVKYNIVHIEPREDALSAIRQQLFRGKAEDTHSDALHVYRADSVYQECVTAAELTLSHVQSGCRYRDISVVCTDPSLYKNTLSMVFRRCGIPLYFSGTEDILDKSVMNTVLSAIDTALGGFEQTDVLRYLKSALSPLSLTDCDRIENYAILWGITGNQWLREWTYHPDGLGGNWNEYAERELDELNNARETALQPLEELRKSFLNASKVGDQILALYAFLEKIDLAGHLDRFAKKLDAGGDNRNAQILNQLWEILLTALEQMYDVLGDSAWEPDAFTRLFRLLLSQYDVGTIPAVLDAVTAGPVSAMRCQESKHLIVVGAVEGSLPGYGGSTGVLSDQERVALRQIGVPLTGGAMDGLRAEFAEIYGVFCGATESVSVTCPAGQPSFIYNRLKTLAGSEITCECYLGPALTNQDEAAAYLARWEAEEEAEHLGILDQYWDIQKRKHHVLGKISQDNVERLYGSKLNLSASQVDKQADCRLSYFLKYGMRAKERKPATIDPAEFGTFVHAVLEQTASDIVKQGGFHQVTLEDALIIADKHAEQYARERFSELDSERLSYLFQRNAQELELIVRELWQELHESAFEPILFEFAFGDNGALPAIPVPSKSMHAQLCGFVDRIDSWSNGNRIYYRIVDYKTGKKAFDYCDVFNGLGLQMLLYLFALEQAGESVLGQQPVPAGVQYFPARAPMVSADDRMDQESADIARSKLWKRKGLLLRDDAVLRAMEPSDTPVRLSYTRRKDGSISGDLADSSQFDLLNSYVFSLLGKMVDDIASGCVTPNPYTRGSSHNACWFCPYGAICHASSVEGRRNYRMMTAERFWEEVEKEMHGNG